jgi:hypothetical protein
LHPNYTVNKSRQRQTAGKEQHHKLRILAALAIALGTVSADLHFLVCLAKQLQLLKATAMNNACCCRAASSRADACRAYSTQLGQIRIALLHLIF